MARLPDDDLKPLFRALEEWTERGLRRDDSLFTPGRAIWSHAVATDLHKRFVEKPDESEDDFMTKWQRQLQGAPDDTIQLAAELYFVHLLTPYNMGGARKREQILRVLSWASTPIAPPESLMQGLNRGFVSDQGYLTYRPNMLWYLIEFTLKWKSTDAATRAALLKDPWAFKSFAFTIPAPRAYGQREVLLYFVFPQFFEAMTSRDHKRQLVEKFGSLAPDAEGDPDKQLYAIRRAMTPTYGEAFSFYLEPVRSLWREKPPSTAPVTAIVGEVSEVAEAGLAGLAEELLLSESFLDTAAQLLKERRQIIFYGPPGTGKTFVAQRLAEFLAGSEGRSHLVQFHPSYAYEDFVEGYRPIAMNGAPGFQLQPGPLRRLAEVARAAKGEPVILVIDEINRGNLPKVFGELFFLLEYRGQRMSLQYSAEPFSLPENLWIIGTMNTSDRSIAILDAALRRRFYFVPFFPDEEPVRGLLGRWLDENVPPMRWVADVVDAANAKLNDKNAAIGPSHFMKEGLDDAMVSRIWSYAVLPYLEELFFGDPDRVTQFQLGGLRQQVSGASAHAPDLPA